MRVRHINSLLLKPTCQRVTALGNLPQQSIYFIYGRATPVLGDGRIEKYDSQMFYAADATSSGTDSSADPSICLQLQPGKTWTAASPPFLEGHVLGLLCLLLPPVIIYIVSTVLYLQQF
jgi:hypothetical protein